MYVILFICHVNQMFKCQMSVLSFKSCINQSDNNMMYYLEVVLSQSESEHCHCHLICIYILCCVAE